MLGTLVPKFEQGIKVYQKETNVKILWVTEQPVTGGQAVSI